MKRLLSKAKHPAAESKTHNQRSLVLEQLENRALMAIDLSISDASATEGSASIKFLDTFTSGITKPRTPLIGPDNNLYVASASSDEVLRYDLTSGDFLGVVVPATAGVDDPWAMAFGPDGRLYVAGRASQNVVRYDFATQQVATFIEPGNGLWNVKGMTFGPDGNLYVSNADAGTSDTSPDQDRILRFQGPGGASPGTYVSVFVDADSGGASGLDNPNALVFQGNYLYVCNTRLDSINRYDATTGAFVDVFVTPASGGLDIPNSLAFRPDGFLYVASQATNSIMRYNASGGAFDSVVIPPGSNGLGEPTGPAFDARGNLYVTSSVTSQVLRFGPGSMVAFSVSLNTPTSTSVTVDYTSVNGTATAGEDLNAVSGTITFAPGQTSRTVIVQSLDDAVTESTETFNVILSNSMGATIADGIGVGTILDNDPFTKFYVVDDVSTDRTYEYGATGTLIENYGLGGGNTAPRGAASTTSGTTVWVVDANKSVYAYNTSGALQGSWAAGGLQATAQLEGIATNGSDVWLVDNRADKVYRYTNAASRTGGSQNAASSFSLNSGNKNPKDIVTDGKYLWVVDDSSTDYVFKYTVAGTFVSSWRISTSGAKNPTGITLDPSTPSHIWIVDSGTDRVYQYDNSVGLTSGSKSANSSWALAAGNTNPQGIADPPPPNASLNAAPTTSVDNNDSTGANPIARNSMQAPVIWLGVRSADSLVPNQPKQSVLLDTKEVDRTILQIASLLPAARNTFIKDSLTPVLPRTRLAEDHSVDLAFADEELFDSLHTTVSHRLGWTIR